jgi:hypothetical protein
VKSLRPVLILSVLAALAVAARPFAQGQSPAMEGYPAVGAPATVTLLAAGAAPRKALRYAIPAGHKANADMTMTMSMAMNVGGLAMPMDFPNMKIGMAVSVTTVAPNGDITYDLGFTGLTVDDTGGANPAIAAALQPMQASITSIKGTATISDRGVTRSTKINSADPSLQQLMGQLTSSAENLSSPFPEEAVGVGARWEVRQANTSGGQTTFQKTVYEIVSIDGAAVSVKVATEQTAPPQSISNPALPAGAEMHLDKMAGTGEGTATIRLDALVPTSQMTMNSAMAMTMGLGGQTQSIVADNKVRVTIAPAK